jgi:hypothetical protein
MLALAVNGMTRACSSRTRARRVPAQTDIFITRRFHFCFKNELTVQVVQAAHFFILKLSMKAHEWLSDHLGRHILDLGLDLID